MKLEALETPGDGINSAAMAGRVAAARRIQYRRYDSPATNASLPTRKLDTVCALRADAATLLREAMKRLGLSARSRARILKLARTIADLAGSENIEVAHVAEAIQYRVLDRKLWMEG